MKSVAIVLLIALVCVVRAFDPDHCAPFMDCESCVAHHLCGWCSLPVVYEGNITGPQCAGFSPNGSTPFACNGIYSTEKCIQGYVCDQATFQCKMGPPGQGLPKDQCEKNCTNDGKVFLCNVTTKKCYNVPPGTPGSSALVVCEQACEHPTSSAGPTGAPAQTYECNHTTGNCIPTTPGKGTSKEVCEQTCTPAPMGGYLCNKFLQKCIKLPPNVPGGKTKEQCEEECNPSPNPGPPNHFLGVWRGFEIHNGYREGEWDMNFTQTSATIINLRDAVTIKGIPYQQRVADITILAIKVTSGPGAGQWWKAIYKQENRGPQTMYLTAAFGKPGESAPSDMATAMKDGSQVFFLAQCVGTPECVFTMPATIQARRKRVAEIHGFINDPCTSYGASCQECLSHQFCGWCSTKVQYADGVQGTQCAGFSSNPNTSNPFVCLGRYSTFKCTTGYDCDMMTYQCVPDNSPGNGQTKEVCEKLCKPTPSPSPIPDQYVCNLTTKHCYKCNETHCPGSAPKDTCEAGCKQPEPGPSGLVVGVWRGLHIENNYPIGEWEWVFNSSGVTVYMQGKKEWAGTIISYGGDVMIITVTSGQNAGKKISALYSIANIGGGAMYSVMTFAISAPDGMIPHDYGTPMHTAGETEMIMAKCQGEPCVFRVPA